MTNSILHGEHLLGVLCALKAWHINDAGGTHHNTTPLQGVQAIALAAKLPNHQQAITDSFWRDFEARFVTEGLSKLLAFNPHFPPAIRGVLASTLGGTSIDTALDIAIDFAKARLRS